MEDNKKLILSLINMEEKELVTALIADHLRHMKLLSGLEKLGFDTLDYYIGIPEIIVKVMGVAESETLIFHYITAVELKCWKPEKYNEAAEELYEDLVWMRKEFQKPNS